MIASAQKTITDLHDGQSSEFIIGTQTTATGSWTGVSTLNDLKDGQQITYWLPFNGIGNATLTLTLADGSGTGALPCYYGGTQRLTTHYSAGNAIHLTYRVNVTIGATKIAAGWWADANYDSNTYDRVRFSNPIKAKTSISPSRFIVGDAAGYFHLAPNVPFDVQKPILYSTAYIALKAQGSANYLTYPSCSLRVHVANFSGATQTTCYIVGTLVGTTFTPTNELFTTTEPTSEDGLTYMALGHMFSAYQIYLLADHSMYRFANGGFKSLTQLSAEALAAANETRTEMRTKFEQTDAALALKADSVTVSSLGERVTAAEQKVTPQAITSTLTSSALFAYDKYFGRNYCLNSAHTYTFINNRYQYENGSSSNYTGFNISISEDLFEHSGNGENLYISFDIKRTNVNASAASTANVYGGIWVYYRYYGSDGTTVNTSGRGYYLRTTDTNFHATDEDWERLEYGPINLKSLNAISLAYFSVGTSNANGTTGTVQYRNPKVEVLGSWTDWSAAPEDFYGMANRMANAESRITQNASNIALKVSTSTYNAEKLYRGATAPASPSTNTLWLDTSVTPNLLKRYTGSAWTAAGAQEVKSSGLYIGSNNVNITTENFLLQLLDPANNENVLMEMSANGHVGFKELYADRVISDSVSAAYAGPAALYVSTSYTGTSDTYFRSLGEAVKVVNNRYLNSDVSIFLSSGQTVYEAAGVHIRGVTGPGRLTIYSYGGGMLCSYLTIRGCSAHIVLQNVSMREVRTLVNGTNRNPYLVELHMNHHVELNSCTFDANNVTYDSVYCRTTHVFLNNCGLYNALQGLEIYMAHAYMQNCKGSCSWAMVAYGGYIIASGSVPNGSRNTGNNGQIFANGVYVDYGTAIPVVTPDETTIQYATTTKSWRGSWRSDTQDVIQGVYSDSGYSSGLTWHRGCMWFANLRSVLSGATIKSATLTLHRKTGSGSSSAKTVYLCAISNTSASGTPSIAANYGAIGTIARNAQVTFSIPIEAAEGLANGNYGGLCLYESPYNFGSSSYSSCYMRMSGTDTSVQPYLEIVYSGGRAVG